MSINEDYIDATHRSRTFSSLTAILLAYVLAIASEVGIIVWGEYSLLLSEVMLISTQRETFDIKMQFKSALL